MLSPLEHWIEDGRTQLIEKTATGEVVVIEIDARSIAELEHWPWPRSRHAELVHLLTAYGASTIAFDIDFSSPSHQGDSQFAAAIAQSGRVVLPIFYSQSVEGDGSRSVIVNKPLQQFDAAWVGAVNIFPDNSGMVREYPAASHIGGRVMPAMATVISNNTKWGDRNFRPDWSIDPRSIPRYAYVDVIKKRVPPSAFAGKLVIIGSTASELGDRFSVPVQGLIPGVMIQAIATESQLQGRALAGTGWAVTLAGLAVITFLFRPRTIITPARYALFAGIGFIVLLVVPVIVQTLSPLSIRTAPWLAALSLCAVLQLSIAVRHHIFQRARADSETNLPNRLALEEALSGNETDMVLVVGSIRRFNDIREGMGMDASSEVVSEVAKRFSEKLNVRIYRLAPELVGWLEPIELGCATEKRVAMAQSVLRDAVNTSEGPVDIQLSYGVDANANAHGVVRIERALAAAETARRENRLVAAEGGSRSELRRDLAMMGKLRAAIESNQLWIAYQPKYSLSNDRILSAEALIRWTDADGQMLPPDSFIPLAESSGAITEVTLFALRSVTSQLAAWQKEGTRLCSSMNISPVDLAQEDFVDHVASVLFEHGLDPSLLTFEVTESAFIRSPEQALTSLGQLRQLGVRLSIDDYGTGFSTLSYLQKMPVQELKIDRCFVTNFLTNESDRVLVRSTIDMAHELGLTVVAEGVEEPDTLQELRAIGCDQIQGYLIGKPMPAIEIAALSADRAQKFVA